MKQLFTLCCLFLWLVSCSPKEPIQITTYTPSASLQSKASFPVGVATQSDLFANTVYKQAIASEFDIIVPSFQFDMRHIHTNNGQFNYGLPDAFVSEVHSNSLKMHIPAMVSEETIPDWLVNYGGSTKQFEAIMQEYISSTMIRYAEDAVGWDVVSHIFDDETGDFIKNSYATKLGDAYVGKAFEMANLQHHYAELFLRESGLFNNDVKLQRVVGLVEKLQTANINIDGISIELTIDGLSPNNEKIQEVIDLFVAKGLKIHLADVSILVNQDSQLPALTTGLARIQESRMNDVVKIFKNIPEDYQHAITFAALRDSDYQQDTSTPIEWPCLFNEDLGAKLMHKGFIDAL